MSSIRARSAALFLATLSAGSSPAAAHMPYVLPTMFDLGKGDHVTVESAFGEDAFVAEVAMRDAPFHLVGPDGKTTPAGSTVSLRDLTVFEANVGAEGT